MSSILVTGGAGYIGSVTVDLLRARGERVVVLDDLSAGHRSAVDEGVVFSEGDIADQALVRQLLRDEGVEACVHFAGLIAVGESVRDPARYYHVNVVGGLALLDALRVEGVRKVVFSSSAAVYGDPGTIPIREGAPIGPTSPYGHTKAAMEQILVDYERAYGLRHVSLRYFNAAGATERRREEHDPETHLIPNVLRAASGRGGEVTVFGDDYPTADGTAIRDYVHVADLAAAHAAALQFLRSDGGSAAVNLGGGRGHSVREVIDTVERVTGRPVPMTIGPRRAGDPPVLVAGTNRARDLLGWVPQSSDLESIVTSAWERELELAPPDG